MRIYRKLLCVLLLFCLCHTEQPKQIFIDYSQDRQQIEIDRLFLDVNDGYFVDIGGYDPLVFSNTLNLYSRGWNGINIQANTQRLKLFFYQRPQNVNLNIAISSQEDQIISFYQMHEGTCSTTSAKVKKQISHQFKSQFKIMSMTLAQICQRYYFKRPTFMTIDIEGVGYEAFTKNKWEDLKCCPQVIMSENNQRNLVAADVLPIEILSKKGYKRLIEKVGKNQVFVHETVFEKYQKIWQKSQKQQFARKNIIGFGFFLGSMSAITNGLMNYGKHYSPFTQVYYHAARWDQNLDLVKINKRTNDIGIPQDRSIMVMHFNPHKSFVIVPYSNYVYDEIKIGQNAAWKLTIKKQNGASFIVYIVNHYYKPLVVKPIIVVSQQVRNGTLPIGHNSGAKPVESNCSNRETQQRYNQQNQQLVAQVNNIQMYIKELQVGGQAKYNTQLQQLNLIKGMLTSLVNNHTQIHSNNNSISSTISRTPQPQNQVNQQKLPLRSDQERTQNNGNAQSLANKLQVPQQKQIKYLLVTIIGVLCILLIISLCILVKQGKSSQANIYIQTKQSGKEREQSSYQMQVQSEESSTS